MPLEVAVVPEHIYIGDVENAIVLGDKFHLNTHYIIHILIRKKLEICVRVYEICG